MRLYLSLSDGFCAFTTGSPDLSFIAAGVFFPAGNAVDKNSAGFAARPPVLVVRFPRFAKADVARALIQSVFVAITRTMARLPLPTDRARRKRLVRGSAVAFCFFLCASAGNASHPSAGAATSSAYPGFDFSKPFPLSDFLDEKVPETLPYAEAVPLVFASAPRFSFLRAPRMEALSDTLFLVIQKGELPKINAIVAQHEGATLTAVAPFAQCNLVTIYAVAPAAVLWLAWQGAGRDTPLRFVSGPPESHVACERAQMFVEDRP